MSSNYEVNKIFLGEIAAVQNYGAFVRIPGCSQQGLIHKSQISSTRVDDVTEVVQRGERVWCKVIAINDDGKISLSMKLVHQGNGTDLDPTGVQLQKDEQRRKVYVPGQRKVIELGAVLDTTCAKCGTRGHLATDCFMSPDGKKYELIPEEKEEKVEPSTVIEDILTNRTKKHKSKKSKSHKKTKTSKSSDDSDNESNNEDRRKKSTKKRAKEKKRKSRKKRGTSSDNGFVNNDQRRALKRKNSEQDDDRRGKKATHSGSKH